MLVYTPHILITGSESVSQSISIEMVLCGPIRMQNSIAQVSGFN